MHSLGVHKYGEYCLICQWEECGYKGDVVTDIEEHQHNHKDLWKTQLYQRHNKNLKDNSVKTGPSQ